MKNNIVKDKSFDFAIRIVKRYQYLNSNKNEFENIYNDAIAILKLITSNLKTSKNQLVPKSISAQINH